MKYVLLTVGAALVGAILKDSVAAISKRLVGAVERWVERRFSSSRRLYARSIRRYRKDVADQFQQVPVPFDLPVELPMDDVYIPLRAAGRAADATAGGSVDLASAVADARSTVVLGPPGSGKSLFLRYLLWSECREVPQIEPARPAGRRLGLRRPRAKRPRNGTRRRLPVLIPLNRLAETGDLPAAIAAAFARHDFPGAANFVERELNRPDPDLVVLLDGLDEVGSDERASVVQLVVDFADNHPDVRFVVTCRTEVYGKALDGKVERILHVADLTDELVERFLHAWPPMGSPAAADRLVVALRDNPRVGELVRNPLLLTMLAYLYTDQYDQSTARLPDNRTQFYSEGSRLLLQRWKGGQNKFRWEVKKLVLQHLAIGLQVSHQERRSITYQGALLEIQQVLPRVSRAATEAEAVLAEIVERSGLLVTLDDGERYQFAHLSMQEYFAAVELRDRPDELLREYKADPDAWREPVKLWCGGDQDSTRVIQAIAADGDEVLALSCLADAVRVHEGAATALVDRMKRRLAAKDPEEAVVRAFGQLAADPRPSGQVVLDYLRDASTDGAVAALAMSNLPEAAKALAEGDLDRTAPYLLRMGNVAVPSLADVVLGDRGFLVRLKATTTLAAIGTPTAAVQLVRALWTDDVRVATYAAIGLLQLTEQPAVEDALAALDPDTIPGERPPPSTWAPFLEERSPAARIILGLTLERCRALLHDLCHRTFPSHEEGPLEIEDWSRDREAGDFYHPIAAMALQRWRTLGGERDPDLVQVSAVVQAAVRGAYGKVGDDPLARHVRLETAQGSLLLDTLPEHRLAIELAIANGSLPLLAFGLSLPPITRPLDARVLLALAFFSPALNAGVVIDDVDEAMAESLWERIQLKPEPFPELVDHIRPETREVLEAAQPGARPSERDWQSFLEETPAFDVDTSAYARVPQVLFLAVVGTSFFFGLQAFLDSSGWGQVGLGAMLVALTTPLWYLLDWNGTLLLHEPAHDVEVFVGVAAASPLAAADEFDGWSLRTLVAIPLVGFTPAWVYGLLRWVHPPGVVWAGVVAVTFLVLTLGPMARGAELREQRARNESATQMLRALFGAEGDRLSE